MDTDNIGIRCRQVTIESMTSQEVKTLKSFTVCKVALRGALVSRGARCVKLRDGREKPCMTGVFYCAGILLSKK